MDVLVIDICKDKPQAKPYHARDIATLKKYATCTLPEEIALRLFLVEDMTPPVVALLGAAYNGYPHFFDQHMQTVGYRPRIVTDSNGNPLHKAPCLVGRHGGSEQLTTEVWSQPFFSLPFRRDFQYRSPADRDKHTSKRTIFREYDVNSCILEERVSGIMHDLRGQECSIGKQHKA